MTKKSQGTSGGLLLLGVCGLGDAVAYLSLVKALRRAYPRSPIRVVVASGAAGELIQNVIPDVEILVFNRSKRLTLREKVDLLCSLRTRRPDIVISGAQPHSLRVPLLALFSGAGVRVGAEVEKLRWAYNRLVRINAGASMLDHYRQLLSGVGIHMSLQDVKPVLSPPEGDKASASCVWNAAGLAKYKMVVGITSGADTIVRGKWDPSLKRWNAEGYAQVIKWLSTELQCGVVMFGTTAERSIGEEIGARANVPLVNLCGQTTVGELQWLLKWCAALVCNDTGAMHLAAALGTPIVPLFGPTDPATFAPFKHSRCVVQGQAPCSPCFPSPTCNRAGCLAMDAIRLEDVIHMIAETLRPPDDRVMARLEGAGTQLPSNEAATSLLTDTPRTAPGVQQES